MKENRSDLKARRATRTARLVILVLLLLVSTTIGILHQKLPFGRAPVGVDALCPFGAIESAYTLVATGRMIQRIAISSFVLMFVVLLVALLFRRAFCGYICPLGTLQELAARLGKRLFRTRLQVPQVLDRPARLLKYLVLIVTVVFSARTASLVIRPYDPWAAYHHLTSNELFLEFSWGVIVLVLTLIGSLLYDRVFCKYLCPMGALLALISPLSWLKVRRNEESCIQCRACDRACPVNIPVSKQSVVSSVECIDCGECVNSCPVRDTLYLGSSKGARVSSRAVLVTVVLMFALTTGITTATRNFEWKTIPLVEQTAASRQFDAEYIRGKMTLNDVITASGVPAEVLMEEFGVTDRDDLDVPMRNLKSKYGFDTEDVRDFLRQEVQTNQ